MVNKIVYSVLAIILGTLLFWAAVKYSVIARVFTFLSDYLPLVLPLLVSGLSILMKTPNIKDKLSILRLSNDIAIGIISFDIWALSSRFQSQVEWVAVNSRDMIPADFVIILLIVGIMTAVGCVVAANFPYKEPRLQQVILTFSLVFTLVVYMLPFGLLKPIPIQSPAQLAKAKKYTVVVPYRDPSIVAFAPSLLTNRYFSEIIPNVPGADSTSAQVGAIQRFLESDRGKRAKATRNEKSVDILKDQVMVVPQDCLKEIEEEEVPPITASSTEASLRR